MKVQLHYLGLLLIIAACSTKKQPRPDIVETKSGWVAGTLNSDSSVAIFKGIPFGFPPVGDLRWKTALPPRPWDDTLSCVKFGASPIQSTPVPFMMWSAEFISPPEPLSEDCLFLNVWTPAKLSSEKLPVFVWIHGGGFVSGSGACAVYDGEAYAKQGIVFVSINYRQGIFGFLAHPELSAETGGHSGNYGIYDQVTALQWVRNNISAFGGDPLQVTIAGQSAGSMSVQSLVASPLARGLFARAIAQSGGVTGRPTKTLQEAEKTGTLLSEMVNAKSIADLRAIHPDSLLSLGQKLPWGSFAPVFDGVLFTEDPTAIFANKHHNDVPVLVGWVTGDAGIAAGDVKNKSQFEDFASKTYKERKDEFLTLFSAKDDASAKASQEKLGLLRFAALPAYQWAIANTNPVYVYQYSYVPTDKPGFPNYGAFHTSEVPFALHTLDQWDRPWVDGDRNVEKYMSSYWINFVKTGNPNGPGLPEWSSYDAATGKVIQLDNQVTIRSGLFKEEFEFLARQTP